MDCQLLTCHMVAIAFPARGHINPLMNLCKILASRAPNIAITFILTEEWLGLIGPDQKPSNITFATIPNLLAPEGICVQPFSELAEAAFTKMEVPFEELLDRVRPWPTLIVADMFLCWAIHVGNRRNIPVALFWPTAASNLCFFYHFQLLEQHGHLPQNLSEKGDEIVDYIPGIPPTSLTDLVHGRSEQFLQRFSSVSSWIHRAQYLLLSSVYEIESHTVDALKPSLPLPIYTVGPSIPYFELEEDDPRSNRDSDYTMKWLDRQPPSSVLYLSLGSFLSVSSSRMDEIAAGLRNSNVRFVWVARGEASRLKDLLPGGDVGIVVPWCDQLRTLTHPSVGGFWTHCGWNSIQEGVYAGLPLLAYPIAMDQVYNCKIVVDDWKGGWRVGEGDIAGLVRKFMDLGDGGSRELRRRAGQLRGLCRHAIGTEGSSGTNISAFIRDLPRGAANI